MTSLKDLWKSRHSTLTNNIVVLLLVFGITPLAIIFLVFQYVFIAHDKESIENLQRENALRVAGNISLYVNQSSARVKILSEMFNGDLSYQNLFWRLDEFLIQHPEYNKVSVLNIQGREICKARQDHKNQAFTLEDRGAEASIQQALFGGSLISPAELPAHSQVPTVSFILPIKDVRAGIIGVLEARMNLLPLRSMIAKPNIGGDCYAYIIGTDGRLIVDPDFSSLTINQDLSRLPIIEAFRAGMTGVWEYLSLQNQQVVGASAVVPATGWGVVVEKSSSAAYGQVYRVTTFFLGLYALTLVAASIRGLIFSQHHIIGPVKALQQEIESLSRGVFPQGLNLTGNDEIGQLSRAFNQMVQHLKQTMVSRDLLAREVGERKLVEEALRRREATLRSIFLTVPLGIGSLHQWILVGGNDFFYKMIGFSQDVIRGRNLSQLFEDPSDYPKMMEQLRQTLNHEETAVIETRWRRRDGQVRDMLLKFAPIDRDNLEMDLVFAAMDMSNLRKMELERLRMDKLESLGILAGGIAHDFNNILTIILGNIELVGLELKKQDKNLDRLLEAEQACQRAQHLARQLLTFARGGMPVKKPVNVGELLQDVVTLALSGSHSAVEIFLDDTVWPVEIDEDQIHQVINNILINADQAMPNGGRITIKVENLVVSPAGDIPLPEGSYVKFSFIDQGLGINEKDLAKIFDPYFTTKKFGNGLGLTAAFSIVKNHQGYLTVDSQVGLGTSFHLFLPAAKTAAQPSRAKVSTMPLRGQGRILLMDDEASIRAVLGHMLQKLGYEAVCVRDGEEVLEAYRNALKTYQKFDAVILDLTIPGGLGGKETMELLLQLDPYVQAIVSSGYGDDPIMANYKESGFNSVIAKPYKISELSQVLNNLLSKKKAPGFRNKRLRHSA
jgi:PAS domain S-box-containing protein